MTAAELRATLAGVPDDAQVLCFDEKSGEYLEPKDVFLAVFRRTRFGHFDRVTPHELEAGARHIAAIGLV